MKRGKAQRNNSKPNQTQKTGKNEEAHDQASIWTIHKGILAIHSDVKEKLSCFHDNLSGYTKKDLTSFKDEVNENEIVVDMKL